MRPFFAAICLAFLYLPANAKEPLVSGAFGPAWTQEPMFGSRGDACFFRLHVENQGSYRLYSLDVDELQNHGRPVYRISLDSKCEWIDVNSLDAAISRRKSGKNEYGTYAGEIGLRYCVGSSVKCDQSAGTCVRDKYTSFNRVIRQPNGNFSHMIIDAAAFPDIQKLLSGTLDASAILDEFLEKKENIKFENILNRCEISYDSIKQYVSSDEFLPEKTNVMSRKFEFYGQGENHFQNLKNRLQLLKKFIK